MKRNKEKINEIRRFYQFKNRIKVLRILLFEVEKCPELVELIAKKKRLHDSLPVKEENKKTEERDKVKELIENLMNSQKKIRPIASEISKLSGLDESTVNRILNDLEERGLLYTIDMKEKIHYFKDKRIKKLYFINTDELILLKLSELSQIIEEEIGRELELEEFIEIVNLTRLIELVFKIRLLTSDDFDVINDAFSVISIAVTLTLLKSDIKVGKIINSAYHLLTENHIMEYCINKKASIDVNSENEGVLGYLVEFLDILKSVKLPEGFAKDWTNTDFYTMEFRRYGYKQQDDDWLYSVIMSYVG